MCRPAASLKDSVVLLILLMSSCKHYVHTQVADLVQDGSFFFENSQVKIWKGKVRAQQLV